MSRWSDAWSKGWISCLGLVLAACSGPVGEPGLLNVHGEIVGDFVPGTAKMMIFWEVTTDSPVFVRKYGQVTTKGERFDLRYEKPPPNEALNQALYGLGHFLLAPYSCKIDEEDISLETLLNTKCDFLGSSRSYMIVYRQGNPSSPGWITSFPAGYSCGRCDDGLDGGTANIVPAPCSEVEVHVGNIEFCAWY